MSDNINKNINGVIKSNNFTKTSSSNLEIYFANHIWKVNNVV